MHIVFVTNELASINNASGGLATFTANIAHIFKEKGHCVSIILASTKEIIPKVENGIDLYPFHVPMKTWKRMDTEAKLLSFVVKEDRNFIRKTIILKYKARRIQELIHSIHKNNPIDIIHCTHHLPIHGKYTKSIPHIIRLSSITNICRGANMPEARMNYFDNPPSILEKIKNTNIKQSGYVVSPSYLIASIAREYLGVDAEVIESPFVMKKQDYDERYLDQYSLRERRYIIHYGGQLRFLKGTHVVAQLAEELLRKYPDLYLVLAGGFDDMQDEEGNVMTAPELVKRGAGDYVDRVLYVGRLVREQLYPLIQHAEVCLLPSRIENLSNACIEAMAMGKIVVATDGASYEQLIDNGINGFLCERDNPKSFLQGIETALSLNEGERRLMQCKAAETIKRLSPDNVYEQYLSFYEKVINDW